MNLKPLSRGQTLSEKRAQIKSELHQWEGQRLSDIAAHYRTDAIWISKTMKELGLKTFGRGGLRKKKEVVTSKELLSRKW